jgi:hypothetical protein
MVGMGSCRVEGVDSCDREICEAPWMVDGVRPTLVEPRNQPNYARPSIKILRQEDNSARGPDDVEVIIYMKRQ